MDYRPNSRGIRGMLKSPELERFVLDRAEDGADYARARAPVRTGAYRASIRVHAEKAGDRLGATVTATVPYAQRVEQKRHVFAGIVDVVER